MPPGRTPDQGICRTLQRYGLAIGPGSVSPRWLCRADHDGGGVRLLLVKTGRQAPRRAPVTVTDGEKDCLLRVVSAQRQSRSAAWTSTPLILPPPTSPAPPCHSHQLAAGPPGWFMLPSRRRIALSAAGRRAGAEVEADGLAVRAEVLNDPDTVHHPAFGSDDLELIGVGEGAAASRRECAAEPVRAHDPVGVAGRVHRRDVVGVVGPGDVHGPVVTCRLIEDGDDAAAGGRVGGVRAEKL